MPLNVIGATGAQTLGTSVDFQAGVGRTLTITVGADTVGALNTYLGTLGTNVTYSGELRDGGQVRVTYPPAPPPGQTQTNVDAQATSEADWELVPMIQTKDLRFFGTYASSNDVAEAWNASRNGTLTKADVDLGFYGTSGTAGFEFANHLLNGTDSFEEAGFVIRQTIRAGRQSDLEASYDGVLEVVTPPTPNSYAKFALAALGTFEWLKRPPSVRVVRRGFDISQEWWGVKKWSASLYGGTGTP